MKYNASVYRIEHDAIEAKANRIDFEKDNVTKWLHFVSKELSIDGLKYVSLSKQNFSLEFKRIAKYWLQKKSTRLGKILYKTTCTNK